MSIDMSWIWLVPYHQLWNLIAFFETTNKKNKKNYLHSEKKITSIKIQKIHVYLNHISFDKNKYIFWNMATPFFPSKCTEQKYTIIIEPLWEKNMLNVKKMVVPSFLSTDNHCKSFNWHEKNTEIPQIHFRYSRLHSLTRGVYWPGKWREFWLIIVNVTMLCKMCPRRAQLMSFHYKYNIYLFCCILSWFICETPTPRSWLLLLANVI